MNKIILLGRLTKEPEILIAQNGSKVGKFSLAVPRKFSKDGEERLTDFFNIVTFGKNAEFVEKYFYKGQQIALIGRAEINQYEDENGNNRVRLQVIAEELNFADGKKENTNNINFDNIYDNISAQSDDDLPF